MREANFKCTLREFKYTKSGGGGYIISLDIPEDEYNNIVKVPLFKEFVLKASLTPADGEGDVLDLI